MADRVEVTCPCCETRLVVDGGTGDVLSEERPKVEDWPVETLESGWIRCAQLPEMVPADWIPCMQPNGMDPKGWIELLATDQKGSDRLDLGVLNGSQALVTVR